MKKNLISFGIAALILAAIAASVITACVDGIPANPFLVKPFNPEVPLILSHPQDEVYTIGMQAAALTVTAEVNDGGTLSYQWYRNTDNSNEEGTAIDDETEASCIPPTDTSGSMYYYVEVTNTLKGKKATAVSDTARITVYREATIIRSVDVTVTAPAKGDAPVTTAAVDDEGYSCGAVSWSPDDDPFRGNTKYTATVTLMAEEHHIFAVDLDAAINNDDAVVTHNTGEAVTLSLEFDATLDKIVSGISVKTQPALSYTHGDTLDLSELVVTLDFDDSTSEDLTLDDFGTYISTHPANGAVLHRPTNNNHPITVSFGELTVNTNNLTVSTKALTITGAAHTKPYDTTTTANGVSVTLGGIVNNEDVSAGTVTAVYTSATAGTRTINITVVTLTGQAAGNYTVTPANNITVTGDGITKADPSVTWPAAAAITYGAALSTSALTGGLGAGSFAWKNGAIIPTVNNSGYQVTFTPTDTANYNTLTQNVSITVNKANITDAAVVITGPVKGVVPAATVATTDTDYTCGTVSWNPNDNPFLGGTVYTATVILTADSNYTFTNLSSATINGEDAAVSNNTGTAVTLSYTFSETDTREVTGIALKTQPDKLIYTHGDPLDLAGLVVTLIHDDTTTEDVTDADFTVKNITTNPAHGNHLVHVTHDSQPVTIIYGDLTPITTNTLIVNKADPTVTWPTGLTATYGQTLANISLPGNGTSTPAGTFTWTTSSTSVGIVGTQSFNMTFTPTDTANYNTLTQDVNITVSKANPTVTWPTGLTATYGQTLANISLPGNGTSTPAGAFTWTTPSTSVGNAGTRSHGMTFTPTDTANYNTLTQNVSITVNKVNPTVTWPTGLTAAYGQTLSNISLPGNGTSTPAGVFTWTTPSTSVGSVGTRSFSMTFTPTDTANYNTLTQNVSITVNKANPTVTWPTGLTATYGQTLSNISLPGNGTSSPAGTFTWTTPSNSVGDLGTRSHNITFTPTDTTNYNTLTNNVNIRVLLGVEMVSVGAGSFQMGQNGNGSTGNVTPVHTVTLTGFYMGKYEVTQAQYQAVMGTNPSNFTTGADAGETQSRRPVERVSWYDALVFCNRLSMAEGLSPAYRINGSTDPSAWGTVPTSSDTTWNAVVIVSGSTGYRLPTEAQWEYAAKGGPSASNPVNIWAGVNVESALVNYAWYSSNSGSKTHEVGKKLPNELGIHDMSGNVYEWCWDWNGTYPSEAQTDPMGASSGSYRELRGGIWSDSATYVRSALRSDGYPSNRIDYIGFRLLRP